MNTIKQVLRLHMLGKSNKSIVKITKVPIATTPGAFIRLGKALSKFGFEKPKSDGLYFWAVQELYSSTR